MRINKDNFLINLAIISPLVGIIYLVIKGLLGLEKITVIKEDATIQNAIWICFSIIWIIAFSNHFYLSKNKSIKTFFNDLTVVLLGFFIYTGIIINIVYTYNNQDKNLLTTDRLTIIGSDSKAENNNVRGSSIRVYYIITNSGDKALQRIGSTKSEFSSLPIGGSIYAEYYKGKLNSSYVLLKMPDRIIDKDLVDLEKKSFSQMIKYRHFLPLVSLFLFQIFLFWFLILFWADKYFTKISYKTLGILILVPLFINFLLFLMDDWIGFLLVLTFLWIGMVSMYFLASKTYAIISFRVDKFRKMIGNIIYYSLLIILTIAYFYFCNKIVMDYLTKNYPH